MNAYERLGRHIVGQVEAQVIGAEAIGDDASPFQWSQLINAAAEAANKGVQYSEDKSKKAQSAAASAKAAQAAISADAAWASAEAQLELAQQSKDPARIGPATALQISMMQAAMTAGVGLSADAQAKRADEARKAAQQAARDALSSPKDGEKAARSSAWQKVAAVAAAGGGSVDAFALTKYTKGGGENWLTATHAGLPGYAWIGASVVFTTALILVIRSLVKR